MNATSAPPLTKLLMLAVLVLAAHLWLLAGSLPHWTAGGAPGTGAPPLPTDAGPEPAPSRTADALPMPAVPVQVSAVRWVPASVMKPVVQPAPAAPAAAKAPAPPPQKATTESAEKPVERQAPTETVPSTDTPITHTAVSAPAEPTEAATRVAEPLSEPTLPPAPAPSDTPLSNEDTVVAQASPPPAATSSPARGATAPAEPAPSMTLDYDVRGKTKGLSYSADAQLQWRNEGDRYSARMEISAFLVGSRVQTSEGRIGPDGLQPGRFGDRRRSTEKAAHFDPAGQRIRFSSNAPDAPLLPGAQDRLSIFMQLGALLQARPEAYRNGSTIELQVAGTGSADVWRFQVGSQQALNLPAGQLNGLRLVRGPRNEHDSTVEIWLAPTHRYLPARIRVTDPDGTQADQQLRRLPALTPQ